MPTILLVTAPSSTHISLSHSNFAPSPTYPSECYFEKTKGDTRSHPQLPGSLTSDCEAKWRHAAANALQLIDDLSDTEISTDARLRLDSLLQADP
jgi:hypothetical protein